MAPIPTRDYPSDGEIVALIGEHGGYTAVDRALGYPPGTLRQYVGRKSRRSLKAACEAVKATPSEQRQRYSPPTSAYPDRDGLVALAKTEGNFAAVARRLGVSRGSLRDYLRIRPETEAAMRATLPPPLTERERKDNLRRQGREHARRYRAAHPDEARAKRAAWYRETPKGRRSGLLARERRRGVPLDAEAQEYLTILEGDPCTWCGGRDPITPDHLTPVSKGGDSRWQNLTGACLSCNASRGPKSVLAFLAYRKGVMI